jgi:uncharacterized membrane protein
VRILLALHIAGGSAALLSMMIPMVAKKGGTLHRRAGWVFVTGMTIVSITALILSAARFLTDQTEQGRSAGIFLFYVAILTGAGVSTGIRVLRAKRRTSAHRGWWDIGVSSVLAGSGVAMAVYGAIAGQPLFVAFAVIGIVNGGNQLAYWLRAPTRPMHWWFAHMANMLGSCIAATTAFLVINGGRLGFETLSLVVWLAPAAVGTPAIVIWTAYYRRKFAGGTQPRLILRDWTTIAAAMRGGRASR